MASVELDQELVQKKREVAVGYMRGVMCAAMIHVGERLGLYDAMAGEGPLTSQDFARRTGLDARFLREWLQQQAAAEVLESRGEGRFELTPEAALVFTDSETPASLIAPFVRLPQTAASLSGVLEAFRTGRGGGFAAGFDPESMPRAPLQVWSRNELVPVAVPKLDGVVERLRTGARVADIGCGAGAAPLAIGKEFPNSEVHGYDNWAEVLEVAERIRRSEGLENVTFHNPDEDPLPDEPTFDLMMTIDCLHDMTRPDLIAAQIRRAIMPDGTWFIVDIDGAATFEENLERPPTRMALAMSVIACLQSSAASDDGLRLGTLGLPEPEMEKLVRGAGFSRFERVSGIEHPLNAYYVARP